MQVSSPFQELVPEASSISGETLSVEVQIDDPDVIEQVLARAPEDRDRYLSQALRVGVLSLRAASGHVDAVQIRAAGETLIADVRELLGERASDMSRNMAEVLRNYFDPESGKVSQRLGGIVREDGELARLLEKHVGGDESLLARTLAKHLGEHSPLFRMLAPEASEGLRAQLAKAVESALCEQREKILREFSLDKSDSALRRLIGELEERHENLRSGLAEEVEEVVKEFSLDREDSALSRLVTRVERAQHTITSEFSLDREDSALSRMSKMIAEFRGEVRESLAGLAAQRKETERTTLHGEVFEDQVAEVVGRYAQQKGDLFERTGATTGTIRHCKVGDAVIELSPDSPAAGARIVFEAKQDTKYDLKKALSELEQARKNRGAGIGVFVFSARAVDESFEVFHRYGDDLVVVWDAEDPTSDVRLQAAYATARALSLRVHRGRTSADDVVREIERSTRAIEKQIRYTEDIRKAAETARQSGVKISERAVRMARDLTKEVERLDEQLTAMRQSDPLQTSLF